MQGRVLPWSNEQAHKVGLWMVVLGNEHLVLKLLALRSASKLDSVCVQTLQQAIA